MATSEQAARDEVRSARDRYPGFFEAVRSDAKFTAAYRGERHEFRNVVDLAVQCIRLAVVSDAFFAQAVYRARCSLARRRVPVLPHLLHHLSMITGQVCIGTPVVIQPGMYLAHGQVVIDGMVEIGSGVVIFPWVTIGLQPPEIKGPTIEPNVQVGSGAKILGPITIGRAARIGANSVVLDDVAPHSTVVGMPARPTPDNLQSNGPMDRGSTPPR